METKKFLDGEGLKTLWDEITALQSDYNETDETSPNYIKNKPFTIDVIPEEVIEEFTFTTSDKIDESTGLPTMQYVQMFDDLTIGQKMNLQFTYPELAAATGQPQYDDNGNIITKTVKFENVEVGNFADAMGSQFLDSPAIMMGPGALIATLPESIQRVAIPNDDIVFVYSNATLANGTKVPLLITALMDQSTGNYSTYIANCSIATFIPKEVIFEANEDVCNSFQGDWTEGDNTKINYIRNKPFGEELIPAPIGEIYEDSFIEKYGTTELNGSEIFMGILNHSFGSEIGKQYEVQYTIPGEGVTTFNFSCVDNTVIDDIPDGVHLLGDLNDKGQLQSILFIMDNAIYQNNDSNDIWDVAYSPNNAAIFWIAGLSKIEIKNLDKQGLYNRIKLTKIPQKYLELDMDQTFDGTSKKPQSGIAVQEALNAFISKMPSSVVSDLSYPSGMGDGHISWTPLTNTSVYPQAVSYALYTEGIGRNENLETQNKETLVDAINEINYNVNLRSNSISGKNLISDFNEDTQETEFILYGDQLIQDETPSIVYSLQPYGTKNKDLVFYASVWDGYVELNLNDNKMYYIHNNKEVDVITTFQKTATYEDLVKSVKESSDNSFVVAYDTNNNQYVYNFKLVTSSGYYRTYALLEDGTVNSTTGSFFAYVNYNPTFTNGIYTEQSFYSKTAHLTEVPIPGGLGATQTVTTYTYDYWGTKIENGYIKVDKTISSAYSKQYEVFNLFNNPQYFWIYASRIRDNEDNVIVSSLKNNCISNYQNYIVGLSNTGLVLIDKDTKEIKTIPIINLPVNTTTFTVNDNHLFIFTNTDENTIVYSGIIDENSIILKEGVLNKRILPTNLKKNVNNHIILFDSHKVISLHKELTFDHPQADYNQTDSTQSDYIKNKPITAEYVTNYLTKDKSIPVAQQMGNSAFVVEDQFINLVIGEKYDIDMNITSTIDNSTITHTFKDIECVDMCGFWKQSSACPGIVIAPELMLSLYPSLSYATLSDGLVFMYTNNFNGAAYDETKCITCVGEIDGTGAANTNITITVNVSQISLEGEISEPYAKFLQADWLETDETKIGYIKNKTGASEYYSFNLKDFVDIEFGSTTINHTVSNPSSNAYYDTFTIAGLIGLGGMDNGKYVNITNIPYEVLYINDAPYLKNRQSFKNIGISSPSLKQFFNYDGIVWFDTIETLHKKWLKDGEFISLWTADNDSYSITAGFAIMGQVKRGSAVQEHHYSQQVRALWEAVFNDPETKIIIEYQDPKNIPHKEGQLILPLSTVEEEE